MPKNSFEETYPWTDANKWGITTSPDTMKWATKAWDEGYLESKTDYTNLVDFNATLESLYNKLSTQRTQTQQQQASTAATQQVDQSGISATEGTPGRGGVRPMGAGPGPAAQNRVPLDQYEALRASGDAIAEKCKIWVGAAGDERGKLRALCRRFLYMGGHTEQSADIQEYANLEDSKRNLMSAVTTSASKTVADRKKFCEDTYRLVEKMETDMRKQLRENYEKWLFVLPLQPAGPTQPQLRAEEEAPRVIAGAKPPTPKAVVELKPKILLTQNLSRPDMISWEGSMRSYFKASNFELCSNDVQVCYLEERMDPASQQLL